MPGPEELDARIHLAHVHQAANAQLDLLESAPVGRDGGAVIDPGCHVDVVGKGQVVARHRFEIEDVDRFTGRGDRRVGQREIELAQRAGNSSQQRTGGKVSKKAAA